MQQFRPYGSVLGASGNPRPYRDEPTPKGPPTDSSTCRHRFPAPNSAKSTAISAKPKPAAETQDEAHLHEAIQIAAECKAANQPFSAEFGFVFSTPEILTRLRRSERLAGQNRFSTTSTPKEKPHKPIGLNPCA